jgi:hypothetical protein
LRRDVITVGQVLGPVSHPAVNRRAPLRPDSDSAVQRIGGDVTPPSTGGLHCGVLCAAILFITVTGSPRRPLRRE